MHTVESRRLLFVVGMHRSGTSALCAALQACGASFGSDLLEPMDGVNREGFWEDRDVVQLNEDILQELGVHWYSVSAGQHYVDFDAPRFQQFRERALHILVRGFGVAPVEAVKDPRLCITLPLWLTACRAMGLSVTVCVTGRSLLEIASSLRKRDGFPLGYSLRLASLYYRAARRNVPSDSFYTHYEALLQDGAAVMAELAQRLPLSASEGAVATALHKDFRHHKELAEGDPLTAPDPFSLDWDDIDDEIEQSYPSQEVVLELAESLVARGVELDRIGQSHSNVLATLDQRDMDLKRLSDEHAEALSTIVERDAQIWDFDHRLTTAGEQLSHAMATVVERDEQLQQVNAQLEELGQMHTHAQAVVQERDRERAEEQAKLERVFGKPVIGRLFRAVWTNESK
tara:strand:- start:42077 stop:43279 length:1203 start_codon:yes stop_codon:yes gene_type:complete